MKLIIDPNNSYQFKTESGEKLLESIHKEAYVNAGKRVSEIIEISRAHLGDRIQTIENTFPDNNYNNVISFMGDRGAGKSTAALSLAKAIIEKDLSFLPESYCEKINSSKIVKIDVIDPSLFQENDRLIEIIVSKMFDQFLKKIESRSHEIDNNAKRELVTRFQEVFQNLKTIHSGKSEVFKKESIEVLRDLAKGGNLKNNFFLLVQEYLKYVGNEANYLLIIIDDFDLNINGAYEMVEDIRQFLHQYNVIIFVACKIEQLYDAVEQNIRETTATMVKYKGDNTNNTPEEMTSKYLLKLFPLGSRCYIKPLNFDASSFTIELRDKIISSDQVENDILQKLYFSTGVLFLRRKNKKHLLIPRNLREFIQFYNFVNDLHTSNNKTSNLENFKNYFRNYWVNVNLTKEYSQIIHSLFEKDLPSKNKYIITKLMTLSSESLKNTQDAKIKEIVKTNNNESNVSLGDVFSVLRYVENEFYSKENQLLLFAIRSYYSIQLTELYKQDQLDKLRAILSTNIYSEADRYLISKQDVNDYWSFGFRHFKEVKDQEEFAVMELLSTFIISLKKTATREDLTPIHLIGHNSSTQSRTEVLFSMFSFFMNLWFFDDHLSKFYSIQELEEFDRRITREELIPCFSADLLDQIIYDLQTEEIKASYKDSYIEIIDFILKRIRSVLEKIDSTYDDMELSQNWYSSIFVKAFYGRYEAISNKLKAIKVHNPSSADAILSEDEKKRLKRIATNNLNYYNSRYFANPAGATSQGSKLAMNNLIKDFIQFPVHHSNLMELRWDMNRDYIEGLRNIQSYLLDLTNLQ